MSCYLYINTSICSDGEIIKIGISNNPEKRIKEFNNGIRHRSLGHFCELVIFCRAFTIKFKNRKSALRKEIKFKRDFKDKLLSRFGNEVFLMSIDEALRGLYANQN